MTKFLILWKDDMSRIPEDIEEQMALYARLVNLVKEDFKSGMLDWGEFVGGHAGYAIVEGTEQEIAMALTKYMPYLKFKANPVISIEQVEEILKAQPKA
ncbi:MAG: hypothetical protein OIN66_17305 [Candidatus Methanoperedens sp.]|nr:hypothetical protein [Candidatus Methanoperedens sp.]